MKESARLRYCWLDDGGNDRGATGSRRNDARARGDEGGRCQPQSLDDRTPGRGPVERNRRRPASRQASRDLAAYSPGPHREQALRPTTDQTAGQWGRVGDWSDLILDDFETCSSPVTPRAGLARVVVRRPPRRPTLTWHSRLTE